MAEIPDIEGTTGTKEVEKHVKIKGERETGKGFQEVKSSGGAEKFQLPVMRQSLALLSDLDDDLYLNLEWEQRIRSGKGFAAQRLQGPVDPFGFMQQRSSYLRSKFGQSESATMTKEHIEEESLLKHVRHISKEIEHLSILATTETHPRQFSSLMEKLIMEQTQLVNFQQEMAISIIQRVTDRPLDRHTSELHVLLSKIHLVSLNLKMQKIKSVDEAQVITDTKLSEQQHHDKMKEGHFGVQLTLNKLGEALVQANRYYDNPFGDTKWYTTENVYYCQHMLVDDLQAIVPQTILVKEPVYQEQYIMNLKVLIKTQQQLVKNLTDLQKQKKGSKLEKELSEQDDLSAGEIGKQQLNELELITEQTDLIRRCIHWVESHKEWPEYHFHYIYMVIFSVHTVNCIHGRMYPGMESWRYVVERLFDDFYMMTYGEKGELAYNERKIMHSQWRFLDRVELRNKTQTSEERRHMTFSAGPLQDDPIESLLKHVRHISKEIAELPFLKITETLPGQFSSLIEKLIMEQKQLVNFQQEMATSVKQRATGSQLDPHTSEGFSDLHVLLSKIHLMSLMLKMQRMKSVDEAQVKTNTELSQQQHQDNIEKGCYTLQKTWKELGVAAYRGYQYYQALLLKTDTKWYMTESVYYHQQMLVDDLQAIVPQTILVKEPVYQEQYMNNLNVLIKTQQQLVKNLTDLQKEKKGSKLEKESSEQDDLSAGEIGKQQLNELELITEQIDLITRCLHWVQSHKECPEYHFHSIYMVMFSVHTVNHIYGRMYPGMKSWRNALERLLINIERITYIKEVEFADNERKIMHSQRRFLDGVELWNKTQTSEERKHEIFSAGPLQDEEPDLEVLHSRMEDISVSDKEEEKTSIDLQESAEATFVSDVINKFHDEDSSTSASGYTPTTQTTQAVTLTTRTDEQAVKETHSHFQDVLDEFNKQTKDISDIEKTDILLQLPYMAVGYFNNNGGLLALEKYDVHLYIPHGAIAEGPPQQVYTYINPDATDAYTVDDEEEQLSPEVHCGPPGLTFKDSVVLTFPHHAESSDWEFTAKMYSASSPAWEALNSSTDGQLVSAKGNKAIFLVNHFTRFSLFGRSLLGNCRKRVKVGAFGDNFDPRSYVFRVYVLKDDKVSEERIMEFEKRAGSTNFEAFRYFFFFKNRGHMLVEMTVTKTEWDVKPTTKQEIHKKYVWSLPENSVSFSVRISEYSDTDGIPYMAVSCGQQQDSQESKILLSVGPKPIQMKNNNLIHTSDAPLTIPAPCCRPTNGSGDNTLQLSKTEFTRKVSSETMRCSCQEGKMCGGLSDQKVDELCEFLDKQDAGDRRLGLLDYLSGVEYISPSKAKDVLTKYFKLCSKHNISDQEAFQYLKWVFHELNYTRAAEIIEPGEQSADAEVEPLLPFLGNESLDQHAEIYFRKIAAKLGEEWEVLATYLGINHRRLHRVITENVLSVSNQIFCMLVIWQEGFESSGEDAFNTLSSALETIGRNDLVGFLKRKVTSMMFFKRRSNRIL